jgi:hypothetical protein
MGVPALYAQRTFANRMSLAGYYPNYLAVYDLQVEIATAAAIWTSG